MREIAGENSEPNVRGNSSGLRPGAMQIWYSLVVQYIWVERFWYWRKRLDLTDRTFGASLEKHITGDGECAGIPTVS